MLPDNLEEVRQASLIFLTVAALASTMFPLLWAFFPWWSTVMGRILMLQSVCFAVALDLTVVFRFWSPVDHLHFTLFINFFVFMGLATASVLMTALMLRLNLQRRRSESSEEDEQHFKV